MPRRRKRARFEQLTEFERGRIIGLREAGLSYRAVASRVQRNSSTVMRVWKQWTDECRTTRKSGSGPRNVTSARDDRHLVRMARTDRTASSRQLAALWSIATGVSLCASSIRRRLLQCGLRARTPLYRIPLTHDHRRLRLQWANQHRDWRADWQHVVFSDESRFNLWYHDGRIRVRRYAGERHLPECIIERHSGRTPGVMVWGAIAYHRRSQLLRIVGNLNSNRYIREVLQPEAVPFLQSLPGAVFQQDNARPHTARIVKSFFAAQQVQLLPWPACSPDMSPIEHVWDVIGRRLARDPRPVASADELWVRVQTIWNALPQSDIQTLFDSMPQPKMGSKRPLTEKELEYYANLSDSEFGEIFGEAGDDSSDYEPSENSSDSDDEVVSEPEDEVVPEPGDNEGNSQATTSNANDDLWTEIQQNPELFIFQENVSRTKEGIEATKNRKINKYQMRLEKACLRANLRS
ncbi:Transposable element Tcb2 transposase, partial [Stegodyphus mimosarum]